MNGQNRRGGGSVAERVESARSGAAALVVGGLERVDAAVFSNWLRVLPSFRVRAAFRYRRHADRVRSAAGFLLLGMGLGGLPERFCYGVHGKPFLCDGGPFFNISHGGGLAAVVLSGAEAGIDVEPLSSVYWEVMESVFTSGERDLVESSMEPERTFCRLWTLKESYVKALGVGVSFPLREVEFRLGEKGAFCSDRRFVMSEFSHAGAQVAVCGSESCFFVEASVADISEYVAFLSGERACPPFIPAFSAS